MKRSLLFVALLGLSPSFAASNEGKILGRTRDGALITRGNMGDLQADLSRAKLYGVDLSEANLREAYLYGAILSNADLEGAVFSNADLERAVLKGAFLKEANFHGACSF